jgi:hypothetical protein
VSGAEVSAWVLIEGLIIIQRFPSLALRIYHPMDIDTDKVADFISHGFQCLGDF